MIAGCERSGMRCVADLPAARAVHN